MFGKRTQILEDLLDKRREQIGDLKVQIGLLEERNKTLELLLAKPQQKLVKVDYNLEDPSPIEQDKRREYVGRVAGFYKDILEPKIHSMISEIQRDLSNPANTEKMDTYNKATVNALSLLLDWGDEMVNEHLSNLTGNKE